MMRSADIGGVRDGAVDAGNDGRSGGEIWW